MNPVFQLDRYTIRRKFLKVFGASFQVFDPEGRQVAFCAQKAFKLKEDIRVFQGEEQIRPLLTIQARQVIDFHASYDIVDAVEGVKVGAAQRAGVKSLFRDHWHVLDANDRPIAKVEEDSMGMALFRRVLLNLIPQTFHLDGGATFKQRFNPVIYKLDVDVDRDAAVDRRLVFGVAVLLAAIEGRQDS